MALSIYLSINFTRDCQVPFPPARVMQTSESANASLTLKRPVRHAGDDVTPHRCLIRRDINCVARCVIPQRNDVTDVRFFQEEVRAAESFPRLTSDRGQSAELFETSVHAVASIPYLGLHGNFIGSLAEKTRTIQRAPCTFRGRRCPLRDFERRVWHDVVYRGQVIAHHGHNPSRTLRYFAS